MQERFASTVYEDELPARGGRRSTEKSKGVADPVVSPGQPRPALPLSPRLKHHHRMTTVGQTVSEKINRITVRDFTWMRRLQSRWESGEGDTERRRTVRGANERTNERMGGRTVERDKRTYTNRTARGFSGRLRGCSSLLIRHGPLADPWWPPRGSVPECPSPPHRRATTRRERQSDCARSLAFFDPPSRGLPSLADSLSHSLTFFLFWRARARAYAAIRTALHAALRFNSPRRYTARSFARERRTRVYIATNGELVCVHECTESLTAIAPLRSRGSSQTLVRVSRKRLLWNSARARPPETRSLITTGEMMRGDWWGWSAMSTYSHRNLGHVTRTGRADWLAWGRSMRKLKNSICCALKR